MAVAKKMLAGCIFVILSMFFFGQPSVDKELKNWINNTAELLGVNNTTKQGVTVV